MVAPAVNGRVDGSLQQLQKLGDFRGDVVDTRGGLDKLLPDQDAAAVAQIVKAFGLDQAAAPDAQQIDVAFLGDVGDEVGVLGFGNTAVKHVERDHIGALDIDAFAVDPNEIREGILSCAVALLVGDITQAQVAFKAVAAGLVAQADAYPVKGLIAVAVGPPKLGVLDDKVGRKGILPAERDRGWVAEATALPSSSVIVTVISAAESHKAATPVSK